MENLTFEDVIAIAKRRWWIAALLLVVGSIGAVVYAQSLPNMYAARARILIESQIIPGDLARSTVDQSVSERVALIRQRLLTRQNMLDIAREYDVFPNMDTMSPTDIVNEMRQQSTIAGAGGGRGRNAQITNINIAFRSSNPQTAARVANDLVSRVIAQNVQQRTTQALGTLAFFTAEAERLEGEMNTMAQQIAEYQVSNQNTLETMRATHQQEIRNLSSARFERGLQRGALEEELATLREQLEIGVDDDSVDTPQSRELRQLRTQLAIQRATLAETHPTIQRLNARIAAVESVLLEEQSRGVGPAARRLARIEEIEAQLARMQELDEIQIPRIARLEGFLSAIPETTIRLGALQRDYSALQSQYNDVVRKRAAAETGERLESTQQAERFEIIEQALPPEEPISPNRTRIMMAGVVGSGAVGFGLVVLLELLNRSIRTVRDLERTLDIQPIATIPYIATRRDIAVRRWSLRATAALVIVTAAAAGIAVDRFVMPLPLVTERIVERLGL